MTISGFTPTTALPGLVNGGLLAGSNQLLAAPGSNLGSSLLGAQAGVAEKPGIGSRLVNAMKAAIGELRGVSPLATFPGQSLAMQSPLPVAPAPVAVKKPAVAAKRGVKAKTFTDGAGNVRQVGTGKILKPTTRPAALAAEPAGLAQQQQSQLPVNATQVPGATVYSYDQNGNPVAPTMQQLGVNPTMLQGIEGMAGAQDPNGPQVNATNQTSLGGLGSGLGSAVPVLGAPIVTAPAVTSQPAAGAGTGGSQTVHNNNATDVSSRNQGLMGGWGGTPWNGIATPNAPYGASMLGGLA